MRRVPQASSLALLLGALRVAIAALCGVGDVDCGSTMVATSRVGGDIDSPRPTLALALARVTSGVAWCHFDVHPLIRLLAV